MIIRTTSESNETDAQHHYAFGGNPQPLSNSAEHNDGKKVEGYPRTVLTIGTGSR
jgi:hypothetical protein